MAVILFPDLLRATGLGIISSIWQAAIVWTIVVVFRKGGRTSAAERCTVYSVAQFVIFIAFLATTAYYLNRPSMPGGIAYSTGNNNAVNVINNWILFVLPYLSLVYFFILILSVLNWVRSFRKTQKIRDVQNELFLKSVHSFINQNALTLGLTRKIEIVISEKVQSAITIGMLKPVILLPLAAVNRLTTEQMEAVLIHELAHIKRNDYFKNLLHSLIEQIMFFNPFIRIISEKIREERENACDDFVMLKQYPPAVYADALLRLARFSSNGFVMAAANNGQPLLARIKRMLHPQELPDLRLKLRNVFFTFSIAAIAFFLIQVLVRPPVKNGLIPAETKLPVQFASAVVESAPSPMEKTVQLEGADINQGDAQLNTRIVESPVDLQKNRSSKQIAKVKSVNEISKTENTAEPVIAVPVSANHPDSFAKPGLIMPAVYDEPVVKPGKYSTEKEPTAFIIIVKEEEGNRFSAHKSITIEVIGNNGMIKTYQWNVDVYQ